MVGPLGSSPTRSQTFQLVIAGCRLLSCRRWLASEPSPWSLLRSSEVGLSFPFPILHPRSSFFPAQIFLFLVTRLPSALRHCPFPREHDSLHRDAAVAAANADVAAAAVALPSPAPPPSSSSFSRSLLWSLVSTGKSKSSTTSIPMLREHRPEIARRACIKGRVRNGNRHERYRDDDTTTMAHGHE